MTQSIEIRAWDAQHETPGAHCCNCGDCAGDAPEEQLWIKWRGQLYCPACARDHGLKDSK